MAGRSYTSQFKPRAQVDLTKRTTQDAVVFSHLATQGLLEFPLANVTYESLGLPLQH